MPAMEAGSRLFPALACLGALRWMQVAPRRLPVRGGLHPPVPYRGKFLRDPLASNNRSNNPLTRLAHDVSLHGNQPQFHFRRCLPDLQHVAGAIVQRLFTLVHQGTPSAMLARRPKRTPQKSVAQQLPNLLRDLQNSSAPEAGLILVVLLPEAAFRTAQVHSGGSSAPAFNVLREPRERLAPSHPLPRLVRRCTDAKPKGSDRRLERRRNPSLRGERMNTVTGIRLREPGRKPETTPSAIDTMGTHIVLAALRLLTCSGIHLRFGTE